VSFTTWTPPALSSEARPWQGCVWRIVEAQHIAATMKLVDSPAEQDLLESLLEGSKPPQPDATAGLDYLLASPFRYSPLRGGSRFRSFTDPGVFYGADTVATACAELGYWRWKFLRDAPGLERLDPVAHTAFRVKVSTTAIDLRQPPFDRDSAAWTHPDDYSATQALARQTRDAAVGAILYQSVRSPEAAWCAALLSPQAFASPRPEPSAQTWWLAVRRDEVLWRRDREYRAFSTARWASAAEL
jgi:hypothetical protein